MVERHRAHVELRVLGQRRVVDRGAKRLANDRRVLIEIDDRLLGRVKGTVRDVRDLEGRISGDVTWIVLGTPSAFEQRVLGLASREAAEAELG